MVYALLLLGLLPAVFLPDFGTSEEDEDAQEPDQYPQPETDLISQLLERGDQDTLDPVIEDDTETGDGADPADPLLPVIEDDISTVLEPIIEDDSPNDTPTDPDDEILQPTDEDDIASAGAPDPDPDDILAPIVEDDLPADSAVLPSIESDTNSEEFLVYMNENNEVLPVFVEGFDIGADIIQVSVDPDVPLDSVLVTSEISPNGQDTNVSMNGVVIAVLPDVTDFDPLSVQMVIGHV